MLTAAGRPCGRGSISHVPMPRPRMPMRPPSRPRRIRTGRRRFWLSSRDAQNGLTAIGECGEALRVLGGDAEPLLEPLRQIGGRAAAGRLRGADGSFEPRGARGRHGRASPARPGPRGFCCSALSLSPAWIPAMRASVRAVEIGAGERGRRPAAWVCLGPVLRLRACGAGGVVWASAAPRERQHGSGSEGDLRHGNLLKASRKRIHTVQFAPAWSPHEIFVMLTLRAPRMKPPYVKHYHGLGVEAAFGPARHLGRDRLELKRRRPLWLCFHA